MPEGVTLIEKALMSEDVTINIRDIQHYMYCPRRFALLEVNDDWAENAFVVKANLLHENVHSGERNFENKRKIVRSDVSVYNDDPKYNIFRSCRLYRVRP